jgi:diaminopimelate decarboxylase
VEQLKHIEYLFDEYYPLSEGTLYIGDFSIQSIIEKYGTPAYVYNADVCRKQLSKLRSAFPFFSVFYSIKANPNPDIVKIFVDLGCGVEVASAGEIQTALAVGCPPSRIKYSGPGKSKEEIQFAIDAGISEIHAESINEIRRIEHCARERKSSFNVSIRVNPQSNAESGSIIMGGRATQFGLDETQLPEGVKVITDSPNLHFAGLHFHSGSQILDYQTYLKMYQHYFEIAEMVSAQIPYPMKTLNLGGGYGIPYFPSDVHLEIGKMGAALAPVVHHLRQNSKFHDTEIIIEPGRYLIGEAGIYLSSIIDMKTNWNKEFLVLDGGLNHHSIAAGLYSIGKRRVFPLALINKLHDPSTEKYAIVGPLCTPYDSFANDWPSPKADIGDTLAIFQSGAYASTSSPTGLLSHPSPMELLVDNNEISVIRKRGTYNDNLLNTRYIR